MKSDLAGRSGRFVFIGPFRPCFNTGCSGLPQRAVAGAKAKGVPMQTGAIRFYDGQKGFGSIRPDGRRTGKIAVGAIAVE